MNAALVVKVSNTDWEVVAKYDLDPAKYDLFTGLYESGKPITGMVTTEHRDLATLGASWNGSSFSGGKDPVHVRSEEEWSTTSTYALLADNVIFMILTAVLDEAHDKKMKAVFSSDVTLVPIRLGDLVKPGSIWNGQEFTEA